MTGVILAAGAGTRLTGGAVVSPKCLVPFEGTALLELQLRALRWCGIDDIVVVVGFDADRVRRACGPGVRFVENRQYASTNSLYSLWLARTMLGRGFVVMNCDVLFHPGLLLDLLSARHPNALLVSYPDRDEPAYGDEEMKVRLRRGRVVDIRKDLPLDDTDAENVGIAKFDAEGAATLAGVLERLVASGATRDWAPRAFGEFAREHDLFAVGTRGLPWTEIDTPADYQRAVTVVFPAIQGAVADTSPALRWGA